MSIALHGVCSGGGGARGGRGARGSIGPSIVARAPECRLRDRPAERPAGPPGKLTCKDTEIKVDCLKKALFF